MTQSKLGEAKAGVTYKKTADGVAASTYLNYGQNIHMKMGADYQATPMVANLNMDIKTNPIKANGQISVKQPSLRSWDVKSKFDFGNNNNAEMTLISTFDPSVEKFDVYADAKIHAIGYDVVMKANSDKGITALFQMNVMRGQEKMSEVNVDITNQMKTKYAKIVFA